MKNELATVVRQVLEDYPNGFSNLIGEAGDSSFRSKVELSEAEATQFVQHSLSGRSAISWQSRLVTTEEHSQAKKKFRSAYQQLQGLTVRLGNRSYRLHSSYETPDLEQKFTSIVFELEPSNSFSESIKVELQLLFQMPMEWVVGVLVYDRYRKDDEPGRLLRSF